MEPLRRAAAGVLLGLAASIGTLIAVLLIAWGHCGGGTGEDCDVQLAVASLAAVPMLLLVAAVLLLLSSRASSRFLTNSLIVLALFVALLPLAMLLTQEWWSLLVFGALLSGLVGYVILPYRGAIPDAASRQRAPNAGQKAVRTHSVYEARDEMQFWAEQVKAKTTHLRRKLRDLRR